MPFRSDFFPKQINNADTEQTPFSKRLFPNASYNQYHPPSYKDTIMNSTTNLPNHKPSDQPPIMDPPSQPPAMNPNNDRTHQPSTSQPWTRTRIQAAPAISLAVAPVIPSVAAPAIPSAALLPSHGSSGILLLTLGFLTWRISHLFSFDQVTHPAGYKTTTDPATNLVMNPPALYPPTMTATITNHEYRRGSGLPLHCRLPQASNSFLSWIKCQTAQWVGADVYIEDKLADCDAATKVHYACGVWAGRRKNSYISSSSLFYTALSLVQLTAIYSYSSFLQPKHRQNNGPSWPRRNPPVAVLPKPCDSEGVRGI